MKPEDIKPGMLVWYSPSVGGPKFPASVSYPPRLVCGSYVVALDHLGQAYRDHAGKSQHPTIVNAVSVDCVSPRTIADPVAVVEERMEEIEEAIQGAIYSEDYGRAATLKGGLVELANVRDRMFRGAYLDEVDT